VIRGRPGGLFQFSGGGAVRIILASASSSMHTCKCPNIMERRHSILIAVLVVVAAATEKYGE